MELIPRIYFCFFLITTHSRIPIQSFTIQSEDIRTWASKLGGELQKLKDVMSVKDFTKIYSNTDVYTSEPVSDKTAQDILRELRDEIQDIVDLKVEMVTNIRKEVEKSFAAYEETTEKFDCHKPNKFVYFSRAKALTTIPRESKEVNCSTKDYVRLVPDSLLNNIPTSRSQSTVHVPTNVYDLSTEIQHTANWTSSLDGVFLDNIRKDPSVGWQYFGSTMGFFKIFPGVMWNIQIDDATTPGSQVDFFDCRSRQWYLQAAAYPKDMVIIVDMSGSMKGRRTTIANHTVSEILNTLTENDFFTVAVFNHEVRPVLNMTKDGKSKLVQATYRNKDIMMRALLPELNPSNMADYSKSLKYAFDVLKHARENTTRSSQCQQVIMLVSDGAPSSLPELFQEYNADKQIRVFSYLLGQSVHEIGPVREMACSNRGFSTQISTLADVKENVQSYLDITARTNALEQDHMTIWTQVHTNQINAKIQLPQPVASFVTVTSEPHNGTQGVATMAPSGEEQFMAALSPSIYSEAVNIDPAAMLTTTTMSMHMQTTTKAPEENPNVTRKDIAQLVRPTLNAKPEMFVSVAQPAYDTRNATLFHNLGILLGVAGLDVRVSTFQRLSPVWKMGVNGYAYMITNNGFLIYHPRLKYTSGDTLMPFYPNVDIAEVEIPFDFEAPNKSYVFPNYEIKLRTQLLDYARTSIEKEAMKINFVTDAFVHYFQQEMKYFFTRLEKTPYSLGIALPWTSDGDGERMPRVNVDAININLLKEEDLNEAFGIDFEDRCGAREKYSAEDVKLSRYLFCVFDKDTAQIYQRDPLCALRLVMLNVTLRNRLKCDETYLKMVYRDAQMTQEVFSKLKTTSEAHRKVTSKMNIEQIFFFHHTGLIRSYNESEPLNEYFITDSLDGTQTPLYKTTYMLSKTNPGVLYIEAPSNAVIKVLSAMNETARTVATVAVHSDSKVIHGVLGVQFNHQRLVELVEETCRVSVTSFNCSDSDLSYYLLNSAGVLMTTSNSEDVNKIGKSFQEVSATLMEHLVENNVFKQQPIYDFHSLCQPMPHQNINRSAATRLLQPITSLITFVMTLFGMLLKTTCYFCFQTLWNGALYFTHASEDLNLLVEQMMNDGDGLGSQEIVDITSFSSIPQQFNTADGIISANDAHEENKFMELLRDCFKKGRSGRNACITGVVREPCRPVKTGQEHRCRAACNALHQLPRYVWEGNDICRDEKFNCSREHILYASYHVLSPQPVDQTMEETYQQQYVEEIVPSRTVPNQGLTGTMRCPKNSGTCVKKWWVEPVDGTNLLLLLVNHNGSASCDQHCRLMPEVPHFFDTVVTTPPIINSSQGPTFTLPEPSRITPPWGCKPVLQNENSSRCTNGAVIFSHSKYSIALFSFLPISIPQMFSLYVLHFILSYGIS